MTTPRQFDDSAEAMTIQYNSSQCTEKYFIFLMLQNVIVTLNVHKFVQCTETALEVEVEHSLRDVVANQVFHYLPM